MFLSYYKAPPPPRRARTRCSVAPPSRLYSEAVLSSALFDCKLEFARSRSSRVYIYMDLDVGYDVHLLSAEDQSLLDGGDAFFLLDSFLYSGDLVLV